MKWVIRDEVQQVREKHKDIYAIFGKMTFTLSEEESQLQRFNGRVTLSELYL